MRYLSTRGRSPEIGFRGAVLSGLAPDGGLYMPAVWPIVSPETVRSYAHMPFSEVAASVISHFSAPELSAADLLPMAERAFGVFEAPAVAPLRPIANDNYLLELFHGPTLAFKDVAMRMLAELYGWALESAARGKTIIGATSGDTGGAAIHAFAGSQKAEVFMLHPKGRISDVQRRIMTTVAADNIVNIAVDGAFDDCQRLIKTLFADRELSEALDLGGVNSINCVRLAVQSVYYFTASAALGRAASFVAPTGNFGDIFAGYAASMMGLPVKRLGVAVNRNDIMRRVLRTGVYEPGATTPTSSPSMDIQVASNFERLLFETLEREPAALEALMRSLETEGKMVLTPENLNRISRLFVAESASEEEVAAKIDQLRRDTGMLIDPHTAVGLVALDKLRRSGEIAGPAISLATAHPAKFPDAVERAAGIRPALPARYENLHLLEERLVTAPAEASAIRAIIEDKSRFKGAA